MNDNVGKPEATQSLQSSWFKEAFMSAQKFYDRDNVLDSKDRLELSNSYRSIARAQLWGGWFGFSAVFLPPFFYKFYKTNAIRGVNVPRNFVMGIAGMILATKISGDRTYSRILRDLSPEGTMNTSDTYEDHQYEDSAKSPKTSKEKQYDMMALLNNGGASKWAAYFYMTYNNPERRFPNPAVKLEELKRGDGQNSSFLNQRDPMGLYSSLSHEKKEGIPKQQQDKQDSSLSSWDKIRQESNNEGSSWSRVRQGIAGNDSIATDESEIQNESMDGDPFYASDQVSQSEFDALLQQEREGKDNYN